LHIDKSLTAILTLNTVAHTIGAAGVGAEAVKLWGDPFLESCRNYDFTHFGFHGNYTQISRCIYWKNLLPYAAYMIQFFCLYNLPRSLPERIHYQIIY